MAAIYSYSKPRFVRGQKLTADDLNCIVNMIEPQSLWTRRGLIGVGIACGLEVSKEGDNYHITKGAAVSSDGCLFYLPNDMDFQIKGAIKKNKGSFIECEGTVTQDCIDMWELEQVTGQAASAPNDFPADAIFLFVKISEDNAGNNSNCFGDIEPEGFKVENKFCIYAVSKAQFGTSWLPGGQTTLGELPFPAIKRLPLFEINENDSISLNDLVNGYLTVCRQAIVDGGSIREAFKFVLGETVANTFFNALLTEMATVVANDPPLAQYYWAYLKDLVAAYEEWATCRTANTGFGCMSDDLFPNFISMGSLTGECRMSFYPVLQSEAAQEKARKSAMLRERLLFMANINNLLLKELPTETKITGSQPRHLPLSQLAIPYYYRNIDQLRQQWNFELVQSGRWPLIPSYQRHINANPLFEQQLCYDLDRFEFYRVEGHIGKGVQLVYSEITLMRDNLNLPFKIAFVSMEDVGNILASLGLLAANHPLKFQSYAGVRPGLEHMGGVVKGGTLVLVYSRAEQESPTNIPHIVVADFNLPYCHEGRPAAMFHLKRIDTSQNQSAFIIENDSLHAEHYLWEVWELKNGSLNSLMSPTPTHNLDNFTIPFPTGFEFGTIRIRLTAYLDVWESHYTDDIVISEPMEQPELKPTALFHEVNREYLDEGDFEPIIRMELANDSVHADEFKWQYPDHDNLNVEVESDSRLILRIAPVPALEKLDIRLRASNTENGLSDIYIQIISICPKDLTFLINEKDSDVYVEEIILPINEVSSFSLKFSHPGCSLSIDQEQPVFGIGNIDDGEAQIIREGDLVPGVYTFICKYPCNNLERQCRIIIVDKLGQRGGEVQPEPLPPTENQPQPLQPQPVQPLVAQPRPMAPQPLKQEIVKASSPVAKKKAAIAPAPASSQLVARNLGQALNSRRTRYRLNVEALAESDRKLASTKSYKSTHHFITTPPPAFADWHKSFEELAKLLLSSAAKPGGVDDAKYLSLLQNATWHYLDRSIAEKFKSPPDEMAAILKALVPAMKTAGVAMPKFLEEWGSENVMINGSNDFVEGVARFFK